MAPGGGLIIRTLSGSTSASSLAKRTVSDVSTDPWRSDSDDMEPVSPTATAAAAAAQSPSRQSPFSTVASRSLSASGSAQRRALWTPDPGDGSNGSDAGSSHSEDGEDCSTQPKRGGSQLYEPAAMNPYCKVLQPAASQPQTSAAAPQRQAAVAANSVAGAAPPAGAAHHQRALSVPSEQELEAWRKRQDAAVAAAAARRRAAEAAVAEQHDQEVVQPAPDSAAPGLALGKTVSSVSSGSLSVHAVAEGAAQVASTPAADAAAAPAVLLKQGVTHARPAITRWLSTDDLPPPPGVSLGECYAGAGPGPPPPAPPQSSEVRHCCYAALMNTTLAAGSTRSPTAASVSQRKALPRARILRPRFSMRML